MEIRRSVPPHQYKISWYRPLGAYPPMELGQPDMKHAGANSISVLAKAAAIRIVPRRWELPARFMFNRMKGLLEPELALITKLVTPRDVVVDVGANVGLYSYSLVNHGAIVHAFEPVEHCRRVLLAYRHPNLTVHSEALSDTNGTALMVVPEWHGSEETALAHLSVDPCAEPRGGTMERVAVLRLDDVDIHGIRILKIDVEGHEVKVINGARTRIGADRPLILVEIEQRHLGPTSISEAFAQIRSLGYRGYFLVGREIRSIDRFDVERDQLGLVPTLEATGSAPGYINNFIFLPEERDGDRVCSDHGYTYVA